MDPQAWSLYLEELKLSDPGEYALLVQDMQDMAVSKEDGIVTKDESDDTFAPKLPGGKMMTKTGVQEDGEGIKVEPKAGFVIKTRNQEQRKVFINVCVSPLLGQMSNKRQLMEDGSEQEGLNIPLSLGPPRNDVDKSKEECTVYDIVVNPQVLTNIQEDNTGSTRSFLCELALQYVEQKYNTAVDYKYKLPKLDYKGDKTRIPPQFIRKKVSPVIEEVQFESKPEMKQKIKAKQMSHSIAVYKDTPDNAKACEAILPDPQPEEDNDNDSTGIVIHLNVEAFSSVDQMIKHLQLSVSRQFVSVKAPPFYSPLALYLPLPVNPEICSAEYSQGTLVLVLPRSFDHSWRNSTSPDPGSRPWLLQNAIATSGDGDEQALGVNDDPLKSKEEEGILPEDRFHLGDMMSQHIKDERERERLEKTRRHEEETAEKAKIEEKEREKEKQDQIQKLLKKAELELKNSPIVIEQIDDDELM